MKSNIISQVLESKTPFTYLHMHKIDDQLLGSAIEAKGSIEIDISVNEAGELFIGHPYSFYEYKNLNLPQNLPLDYVIDAIEKTELIIVIDCKDVRAIEWIYETIERLGEHRILVHSWVDSLLFKPYDATLDLEPHWIYEDLPLEILERLYKDTGVGLILSSRGLSNIYIDENYDEVMRRIEKTTNQTDAVINLNLPNKEIAPSKILNDLLAKGILTLQNVDYTPQDKLPNLYIGSTDFLDKQTSLFA